MPETYNTSKKPMVRVLELVARRVFAAINVPPVETWTFVLEDDSEVEKKVSAWTSGT